MKPLLSELLKAHNIEQSVSMEFLNSAPGMQMAAAEKHHRLKALVKLKKRQQQFKKQRLVTLASLNLSSCCCNATDMHVACKGVLPFHALEVLDV